MTRLDAGGRPLILASRSAARAMLLRNAGLAIDCVAADIDERAAEAPLIEAGLDGADVAQILAQAKAGDVAVRHPDALVIAADQTLTCEGTRFSKPADIEAARRQLLELRGRTHVLHSAVVCARGAEIVFTHVAEARMTMRDFQPAFLGRYLAAAGEGVLDSVGAYRLEGPGIQLFERIDGDYFTILGLPLLPLLAFLRGEGVIET